MHLISFYFSGWGPDLSSPLHATVWQASPLPSRPQPSSSPAGSSSETGRTRKEAAEKPNRRQNRDTEKTHKLAFRSACFTKPPTTGCPSLFKLHSSAAATLRRSYLGAEMRAGRNSEMIWSSPGIYPRDGRWSLRSRCCGSASLSGRLRCKVRMWKRTPLNCWSCATVRTHLICAKEKLELTREREKLYVLFKLRDQNTFRHVISSTGRSG